MQTQMQQFYRSTMRQLVSFKPPLQVCGPCVHTDTKAVDCSNREALHAHTYVLGPGTRNVHGGAKRGHGRQSPHGLDTTVQFTPIRDVVHLMRTMRTVADMRQSCAQLP